MIPMLRDNTVVPSYTTTITLNDIVAVSKVSHVNLPVVILTWSRDNISDITVSRVYLRTHSTKFRKLSKNIHLL